MSVRRSPWRRPGARSAAGSSGGGVPVLLLHGGPGLSYEYLDGLADELGTGFRVAAFQQRGLEPSTLKGPFTIPQAIDDVIAVLDGLGWPQAVLVGHSWGGHLVLRAAAAAPGPAARRAGGGSDRRRRRWWNRGVRGRDGRANSEGRARSRSGARRARNGRRGHHRGWARRDGDHVAGVLRRSRERGADAALRMSIEAYSGLIGR